MFKKCAYLMVIVSILFSQSCGVLILSEDKRAMKKYHLHEEQYHPYKIQNTIEGYKEFIAKYPENMFVRDAELEIENLEFSSYEKADSVESYMEFKMRYPNNRHVSKANVKIEQVELKRYEKTDTIEGYKEFLSKYPASTFAMLAKERLQELEFRAFDRKSRIQYGFDLLRYRLHLRRLKKRLTTVGGVNLGDFTPFATITTHEGKNYFHTHLIYSTSLSYLDATSKEVSDRFFDPIISKALAYLDSHFMKKGGIDGFSFDVSSSTHSFYGDSKPLLNYYFPLSQINLFAKQKINKEELLAQSAIVSPREMAREAKGPALAKVPKVTQEMPVKKEVDLEKLDGPKIMAMVSERERGEDYIISRSWKMGNHSMKNIEKRKNYRDKNGFIDKSITRYIDPPDQYGITILTWNYKNREKAFWHRSLHSDTKRITDTEQYIPPAETDFCLTDYVDIKVGEEKHKLLKSEDYEGKTCFIIESTPFKKNIKYGKRISWVDHHRFIPLKIEYYDEKGVTWKTLYIEWQNKFGFWFWKKAVVENVQAGNKTLITTEDVRINLGLHDRDFTRQGLEKQKHGL